MGTTATTNKRELELYSQRQKVHVSLYVNLAAHTFMEFCIRKRITANFCICICHRICLNLFLRLNSHLRKCQHICTRDTFVLFSGRPQHSLIRYLNPLCRWVLPCCPIYKMGCPMVALLPDVHSIIKFDVEQFAKFVNVKKFKSLQ